MIKYLYRQTGIGGVDYDLKVKLDNYIVGAIKKTKGGFWYVPKGQKVGGDVFDTVEEVKRSIEEE